MSKSPLINGKLPNGKWRNNAWGPSMYVIIIGDYCIFNDGAETKNYYWGNGKGWTKIESIVEVYYKKL